MSWMNKNTAIKAPERKTSAEAGSAGFKDGDKANVVIERIGYKPTDNANVISTHGQDAADNAISIMLRVKETADGKNINRCLFPTLYIMSKDPARASRDAQFLATYCTLAEENHGIEGIYDDLINGDELPSEEDLKDLIGVVLGVSVGVFVPKDGNGSPSEFVRAVSEPHKFEADAGDVAQGSGRRRSRNR